MSERNDGGPAFPHKVSLGVDGYGKEAFYVEQGMALRDYLAAHAPITMAEAWAIWTASRPFSAVSQASERGPFLQWFADFRLEYADAMIASRQSGDAP